MGIWTPFSWFHDTPTAQWGAIVDTVPEEDITDTATTLFDRGYGWVYLHSADAFGTESTHTIAALDAVEGRSARRLSVEPEQRRLQAAEPKWGCDDTLFECRPVCLQTSGVTTIKLGDSACNGAPMDQCSCACYYNAHWTCKGDDVICVASMRDEVVEVGAAVCTSRGTPKPLLTTFVERVASTCEKKGTTRGSWPAQECLAQWNEVTDSEEVEESTVESSEEVEESTASEEEKEEDGITVESFAAPAFLAVAVLAQI